MIILLIISMLSLFFNNFMAYTDAALNNALYFQDSASPFMDGIIAFHDSLMFFLIIIGVYVTYILGYIIYFHQDFKVGYYLIDVSILDKRFPVKFYAPIKKTTVIINNTLDQFLTDINSIICNRIIKPRFNYILITFISIWNTIYTKLVAFFKLIPVTYINNIFKSTTLYSKLVALFKLISVTEINKFYNDFIVDNTTINNTNYFKDKIIITHHTNLEIIWTVIPALILMMIAGPSFALLYATDVDTFFKPYLTLKVIGHQWYWEYQYNFGQTKRFIAKHGWNHVKNFRPRNMFNSYMLSEDSLEIGTFRLLEVDNRTIVPIKTQIRFIVTSQDVLHSWCIPSLGIKIDACPGRINEVPMFLKRGGVFYGQCSEICGINHAFMPIVIQGVDIVSFFLTNEFNEFNNN